MTDQPPDYQVEGQFKLTLYPATVIEKRRILNQVAGFVTSSAIAFQNTANKSLLPMSVVQSFIERFLEPAEWLGEILFGLIMVLTITLGAGLLVPDGPDATREILGSVLGCILAWALIDAIIFVMNRMFNRSRTAWLIEGVQKAADEQHGLEIIRKELDPKLTAISSEEERMRLYRDIFRNLKTATVPKTTIQREEIGVALVTFLLVMFSTVPALLPFLFIKDRHVALPISNGLLLAMLFFVGYCWARHAKTSPWSTGLVVMMIGLTMVGIAKLLGG